MYFSFRTSKNLEVFKSLKFRLIHKFYFSDEVVPLDFPSLVGGLPCVCVVFFFFGGAPLLFSLAGSFGLRSGFTVFVNAWNPAAVPGGAVSLPVGL